MIIFPENTHLQVEQIDLDESLTVVISSTEARAACTYCGTTATHIHSRYHRRLSDLPVSGYPVKLLVEVRRFFCQNPSCSRKTFAEALLPLARRYAQRTNRLQTPLQPLGLALGAQAGARVSVHLGLASSPSSLLHNLTESVSPLFPRIRAELAPSLPPTKENALSSPQGARQQQYRDLLAFSQQGLGPEQIAPLLGLSERTVSRWLTQAQAPSWHHHARSSSVIDPYQASLLKRWQEGCRKGSALLRELKAQGYQGSARAVYRYLTRLQAHFSSQGLPGAVAPVLSSQRITWVLVKEPSDLDEEEQQDLATLRQNSATAERVYHLVQTFGQMVRLRQGERLDQWLQEGDGSAPPELQSFAAGIQRDKAAVQAGLPLPSSNGVVEGHVNRLKLIKRSMDGRAKFDLLRLRVLSTACFT